MSIYRFLRLSNFYGKGTKICTLFGGDAKIIKDTAYSKILYFVKIESAPPECEKSDILCMYIPMYIWLDIYTHTRDT